MVIMTYNSCECFNKKHIIIHNLPWRLQVTIHSILVIKFSHMFVYLHTIRPILIIWIQYHQILIYTNKKQVQSGGLFWKLTIAWPCRVNAFKTVEEVKFYVFHGEKRGVREILQWLPMVKVVLCSFFSSTSYIWSVSQLEIIQYF